MAVPFLQLGDLKQLVTAITSLTRPVGQIELTQAINYGYFKGVRALQSVRPNYFITRRHTFQIVGSQTEYDISNFDHPIVRIVKLIVPGQSGANTVLYFQHRSLASPEFQAQEASVGASRSYFLYDISEGQFTPPTSLMPTTPTVVTATLTTVTVDNVAYFNLGSTITMNLYGRRTVMTGGSSVNVNGDGVMTIDGTNSQDFVIPYHGTVIGINGSVLTVSPAFTSVPAIGTGVVPLWTRMLSIAPAPAVSYTGDLWWVYEPRKLVNDSDFVDPWLAKYGDMIATYAVSWLKRATNDNDADKWQADAQEMRSELMQNSEPLSGQNTEGFGSDLMGLGDG